MNKAHRIHVSHILGVRGVLWQGRKNDGENRRTDKPSVSDSDNPEADPDDPLAQPSSSIEMSDVGEEAPSSTPGSSGISGRTEEGAVEFKESVREVEADTHLIEDSDESETDDSQPPAIEKSTSLNTSGKEDKEICYEVVRRSYACMFLQGSSREANSVKEGQQDRGRQPQGRPAKQRQQPSSKVTSGQYTPHIPPWHPTHITMGRNFLRQFNTNSQRI
ncbi:hypothetical protein O3P69_014199 [Scylla paramamosain]|uniref:Uncharacterized protein n=1 Tax=Scylla paramamosain TaxID=85552 RepID=A0AAW0SAC1_SCYPA